MSVTHLKLRRVLKLLAPSMTLVAAPLIQSTLRLVLASIVVLPVGQPFNHCVLNVLLVILLVQKVALCEPLLMPTSPQRVFVVDQ